MQSNWYETSDGFESTRNRGLHFDIGMWAHPLFHGRWPDEMKMYTKDLNVTNVKGKPKVIGMGNSSFFFQYSYSNMVGGG